MKSVIVIGGGPSGLAAAEAALQNGAEVILLDAGERLGGQFWRHPPDDIPVDRTLQHNWRRFTELNQLIRSHPAARVVTEAQVWAIDHDQHGAPRVHAAIGPADAADRHQATFSADSLIIATGAHDHTLPFPGWDLPGVFTGGAAQSLVKSERVAVGKRAVVAGAGPFLLPVAASLARIGSQVLGVYEASRVGRLASGWLPNAPWLIGKGPEFAGYLARLARHRIPYRIGHAVVRAHGRDAVEGVTIAKVDRHWRPVPGTERDLEADAVCVSHGFTPRLELAIAAGCKITTDRFVEVDHGQRTSQSGVFAVGETTGIGGSDLALIEGRIAGHLAAGGELDDPALKEVRVRQRRLEHLARSVRIGHAPGSRWTEWLTEDTVMCRCEEVSYAQLRSVLDGTTSSGLRSIKLTSRAGLGPCQGRMCGRAIEHIVTAGGTRPVTDGVMIDRRPIAAPIRFSELAEGESAITTDQEASRNE
ncbi:FAD-dependent oxidoreductase [Microlunatus elymi]|uniref:FAD-dependent oxidoreductase n=2 Tax=Microlunatus elymi TaxID=2596828 RepID=A0A516Q5B6_9ACTN|nr:FAD-dependent oxidoreductase [Microlunatus elymi]